jgi:hypothetical protein
MGQRFDVAWEGELPATPPQVWAAITRHTTGWYWNIEYEPWQGGAERGLTPDGGSVITWEPAQHFVTRTAGEDFNELDYRLEPAGTGTRLRFRHTGVFDADFDRLLDSCRQHTAFYYHSLGEYLRHFGGRDAVYIHAQGPARSADGGFRRLRAALGVGEHTTAGDRVRTAVGPAPIDGVVDYVTAHFLGIRTADALYRFYGRDAWGMPVGLGHHLFAADADEQADTRAWSAWLDETFTVGAAGGMHR